VYINPYFDLAYRLPPGWREGMAGPDPSESGYYVLSTLVPDGEFTGTILIAAQDTFFASEPDSNAAAMVGDFRRAVAQVDGMTIDREPSEVTIGDRRLQRVDFSGVGLYRAMLATEIRCHLVSFNLTTKTPEQLGELAEGLRDIASASAKQGDRSHPPCIKDYAVPENILQRTEPIAAGSRFTPIPVRIIIAADGSVKHVHVIRATAREREAIESALRQWKFRPYRREGSPLEIETGLALRLGPPQP